MSRVRTACVSAAVICMLLPAAAADAYPRPGRTELASRAPDGTPGDALSFDPAISADGRFVAFQSDAEDLVPHDTNGGTDIFVYDRLTRAVERVSVNSDGAPASGHSYRPAISGNGRYVAFESYAENLVPPTPGDNNRTQDVFVHDRITGTTEIVSISTSGAQAGGYSSGAAISRDGRYVAFSSVANDLTPGDTNTFGDWDVFVRDRVLGTTERASVSMSGGSLGSQETAAGGTISDDGRFVAFSSNAASLVEGDTNRIEDIYVRDRVAGTTERVGVPPGQEPNGQARGSAISGDGRYVAFGSQASNLIPQDANGPPRSGGEDIFVYDRATRRTERVSVSSDGAEGNSDSFAPTISRDGRYVAFESIASNLVVGDADLGTDPITGSVNGDIDVFVHDRVAGSTDRVSLTSLGTEPDALSQFPGVSDDGSAVVFATPAANLVDGDAPDTVDIFVRDRGSSLGVGGLAAEEIGEEVRVSGWATFSGEVVASASDPSADGDPGAKEIGAELVAASVVSRPESGDLLVRMDVAALPSVRPYHPSVGTGERQYGNKLPSSAAASGIVYIFEVVAGGVRYEARAARLDDDGWTAPELSLWRCPATCERVSDLAGSYGATGDRMVIAIPLSSIGASEGAALSAARVRTGLGDADRGLAHPLDDAVLGSVAVPAREVRLGVAPAGTPQDSVVFEASATLSDGGFVATLRRPGSGSLDAWARTCLGTSCVTRRVSVA